jgi:butyryl-CoA dehydrogenase
MRSIDLLLTEDEILVNESAEAFAREKVLPLARKIDHEHYFPKELIPQLAQMGFLGVSVADTWGGSGLSTAAYALIIEQLAKVCASTSVIVSAHNSLALWPLEHYGTDAQKKKYLPEMTAGKWLGCFALSEPGTGSDAARQTCIAKKEGNAWRVNGVKNWITNAPEADVCILFTMHDPQAGHKGITAFILDMKTTKGVSLGKHEEKLGICGSPTSSIILEDALIPEENLLGSPGEGFKIAMSTLDGGRVGIAAQACGIGAAALADALRYTTERKTFGKFLHEHQSIQNYLADMSTELDAARLLTLAAARKKDKKLNYTRDAAQAKLFASEAASRIANKALQIHGGYGYVKEFNVERYLRDAKITEIYEGTSEIQRLVIAAQLVRELS